MLLGAVTEGILLGGVYALIVLGVVVVYKATKVVNLAHGGVLMFCSYLLWWLLVSLGLPLPVALILLAVASALIGLTIHRLLSRQMIGQSGLITFILTLVLGFSVIQGLTILIFGGQPKVMPAIFPAGTMTLGTMTFSYTWLFSFVVAMLMFLVFVTYFRLTRDGLAMRCVSEDHLVSQSMGINVKKIFAIAWVIGCLSAAMGGMLLGSMFAVDTTLGGFAVMRALPVLLLGGFESIPGALIAALIIGVTESLAGTYIDQHVSGFRQVLPYILMVVILMVRPHGLFGLKGIRRI